MTHEQAEKLGASVLAHHLDCVILPIERGDRYVIRVTSPCWFVWEWDDLDALVTKRTQRRRVRHKEQEGVLR